MPAFTNPVLSKRVGHAQVTVFGNKPPVYSEGKAFSSVIETAISLGADPDKICFLRPPGTTSDRGFKEIHRPKFVTSHLQQRLLAEGTWLTKPGQAVVLPTRDCLSGCLVDPVTGRAGLVHCGREASRPAKHPKDKLPSIITLLRKVAPHRKREQVLAFLSGSICPDCFGHTTEHGKELVKDFADQGEGELLAGNPADGKLRMISCNRLYLTGHGCMERNIQIDDTCTKCSPAFTSYRAEDKNDNYTFLVIPIPQ